MHETLFRNRLRPVRASAAAEREGGHQPPAPPMLTANARHGFRRSGRLALVCQRAASALWAKI
jgi:hypothetical protein